MSVTRVARYYSRWDLDDHNGRVNLYDENNIKLEGRTLANPAEFQLIVELLRTEKPIFFDSARKHLRTGFGAAGEPVGEQEA